MELQKKNVKLRSGNTSKVRYAVEQVLSEYNNVYYIPRLNQIVEHTDLILLGDL